MTRKLIDFLRQNQNPWKHPIGQDCSFKGRVGNRQQVSHQMILSKQHPRLIKQL